MLLQFYYQGFFMTENREIKSSVFSDLFGDDELVGKKNFLALYNAIHGSNLKFEEIRMERKIIPQSLYKTFNSDVTMEIDDKIIVFVEHQSTINFNMPLRFLEYFVHILYGIVPARARYRKALYKIPAPEFYVLYNGKAPMSREIELKLSEAFMVSQSDPPCEVKVKVVNIGGKEGLKLPIVQKCGILKEYCRFMEIVLQKEALLQPDCTNEQTKEALEIAIRESIEQGILTDYLTRKSTEVINMFLDEYDYDTDIAVQREEAMEEGFEQGIEQGIEQKSQESAIEALKIHLSPEKVSKISGLPLKKVLELQATLKSQEKEK